MSLTMCFSDYIWRGVFLLSRRGRFFPFVCRRRVLNLKGGGITDGKAQHVLQSWAAEEDRSRLPPRRKRLGKPHPNDSELDAIREEAANIADSIDD